MKKRFTFKSAMLLAAVLCLTSVTVFAATRISSYISVSPSTVSTTFPTEETLQKELGFAPKTVDTFSNGYAFSKSETGGIKAVDKDGKNAGEFKEVTFHYASGDGDKISLNVHKIFPDSNLKGAKTEYKGLTLFYTSQKYKFVPENYKMTEEDKKAQKSGEIEFSYGGDAVEMSTVQNVIWTNNGISYNLLASDSKLAQADLTAMAKEIVDKGK